ncbi:tail tape measure protein [Sphingorhabdus arenilitoris]|uniref:Tail tape measure protein n=1 Tax=Sphingorhabdus arenilitoris TaxID=1490041 RepID=A0ABV8RGU2_9SPHN
MDEEIERLVVSVRADTRGFAADVDAMRAQLDGPFAAGLDRAGKALENSLTRAIRTGKFGFDDLRNVALSVLAEIATAAISSGLNGLSGGGQSGGQGSGVGGLLSSVTALLGNLFGSPGRATGGPVSPGRAYRVGENGPELFVPTSSGRVETSTGGGGAGGQAVNLTINISDNGRGSAPESLQRSSRQVARMVRQALSRN